MYGSTTSLDITALLTLRIIRGDSMLKDWHLVERIESTSAYEDNSVVMYPRIFTDLFLLPLQSTNVKEKLSNGMFSQVIIYSPDGLTHGYYARLLIVILTTQVRKNTCNEFRLEKSISALYKRCTGRNMGGGSQAILESVLEKIYTLSVYQHENIKAKFAGLDIRKSLLITEHLCIKKNNEKMTDVVFKPSDSFKNLVQVGGAHPIDMRALQFFRANRTVFALDLYIYLTRKAVHLKTSSKLLNWELLKSIFPNIAHLKACIFKQRIKCALMLVKLVYLELNAEVIDNKGLLIKKSQPHVKWINRNNL